MFDKFVFSNGQALATLNSTGVVSENFWDLEENVVADQQVMGWVNGIILSSTNANGNEGLWIEVRLSDNTDIDTTPMTIGARRLLQGEITAGFEFSIGFYAAGINKRYMGLWFRADTTSLDGATAIDAQFELHPHQELGIQKRNLSAGASN